MYYYEGHNYTIIIDTTSLLYTMYIIRMQYYEKHPAGIQNTKSVQCI